MRYILYRLAPIFVILAFFIVSAQAQQPSATPKQISIQNVTFESAALPGGSRPWIKVVATFQSTIRWADGIVFSYTILLSAGEQHRVLPGTVRYANVKGGNNRAVMYISPNTAERFGAPVAARRAVAPGIVVAPASTS